MHSECESPAQGHPVPPGFTTRGGGGSGWKMGLVSSHPLGTRWCLLIFSGILPFSFLLVSTYSAFLCCSGWNSFLHASSHPPNTMKQVLQPLYNKKTKAQRGSVTCSWSHSIVYKPLSYIHRLYSWLSNVKKPPFLKLTFDDIWLTHHKFCFVLFFWHLLCIPSTMGNTKMKKPGSQPFKYSHIRMANS